MLIERYVGFVVEKKHLTYFGALPAPFVAAFSSSDIPVAGRSWNDPQLLGLRVAAGSLCDRVAR